MNNKMVLTAVAAAALCLGACAGSAQADGNGAGAFSADSVRWADTLEVGGCVAKVDIKGLYPESGEAALVDSVRSWIGERLGYGVSENVGKFRPTESMLADGSSLAASCGSAIMSGARTDFEGFAADGIDVQYEFQFSFGPEFSSANLLTYFFSGYVYLGGAHGGAIGAGQTFDANSGLRLTAANIFEPESLPEVIEIVKEGLWEQYFKENAGPDDSLADALLINPDSLELPAFPPVFTANGLVFTYQQYEIACYAAGMPSCLIPYASLKAYMRPQVAALLP